MLGGPVGNGVALKKKDEDRREKYGVSFLVVFITIYLLTNASAGVGLLPFKISHGEDL
jgi:hypothetical protein